MKSVVKKIICVSIAAVLFAFAAQADQAKHQTALAADIWNSFNSPKDLEAFLSTNKRKSEQVAIKKIVTRFTKDLGSAVYNNGTIQFGSDKTQWAVDSDGGIWIDNKLFVPKHKSSLSDIIQQFKKWQSENQKTSMMSIWIAKAYADNTNNFDSTEPEVTEGRLAFLVELQKIMDTSCFFGLNAEALKKIAAKEPAGTETKVDNVGIICPDQNPGQDVIFASASGSDIILKMNGEFATGPTTKKRFLKKMKIIMNDENKMNLNFIESTSPTGSELHTVELRTKGTGFQIFNQAEFLTSDERKCMADIAERMPILVDNVCKNVKVSSYIQRKFGQLNGQQTKKVSFPDANEQNK